jgi:hypothetical protein
MFDDVEGLAASCPGVGRRARWAEGDLPLPVLWWVGRRPTHGGTGSALPSS